ncbi:MAG: DUF5009 domain-containing protein, partial [Bacteroidales bacterium]|nr:DUF5009 domain-containing protein [Bacteroidales bacterium]
MGKRFLSLDFLRGISIFGMIFSAIVPYGVLPAWMYHVQNPPPTHALDTSISGIGWVDLVFPVFIFCMGAAIPLSGQKKLQKKLNRQTAAAGSCGAGTPGGADAPCGAGTPGGADAPCGAGTPGGSDAPCGAGGWAGALEYLRGCFGRFIMLWLFSYLYVLTNFTTAAGVWPQIFTILGFGAIALLYAVLGTMRSCRILWIRVLGVALLAVVIAVGHFCFDEVVSVHRRGIIIFLLAFLYLFGSIIWYFTRNRTGLRWAIFGLLLIFTYITKELGWPATTYANPNIRWWFNMEYFYFLLILLPATFVGELLSLVMPRQQAAASAAAEYSAAPAAAEYSAAPAAAEHSAPRVARGLFPALFVFVAWQCYALYMNMFALNLAVSALFVPLADFVVRRCFVQWRGIWRIAVALHLLGLVFIPIEGSISKVPCTISYCLVTFAIAVYLLMFSDFFCCRVIGEEKAQGAASKALGLWAFVVRVFSGAGQNPLMSYIAFDNLVLPLMKATGFISLYGAASLPELPITGVLRAAVVVFFTMWVVYLSGKKGFV